MRELKSLSIVGCEEKSEEGEGGGRKDRQLVAKQLGTFHSRKSPLKSVVGLNEVGCWLVPQQLNCLSSRYRLP